MRRDYGSRQRDEDGCCWSVCRCLARIPCSSFCIFLTLIAGTVAFIGSLYIAFYRTRNVIGQPDLWPWFMYACIGVSVGMLLFVGSYLAVASVSSTLAYATVKQNLCLRIVNCVLMVFGIILQLAWTMTTVCVSAAVIILLLFFNQYNKQKRVNLSHYGIYIPKQSPAMAGDELNTFHDDVQKSELLICYSASLVCSVSVTAALSILLINTAYNFAKLNFRKNEDGCSSRPSSHLIAPYSDGIKSSETIM